MIGPSFRVGAALDAGMPRLRLLGELDLDGTADLRAALAECFARRPDRVVVDMRGLRFCDCAGLNVLLEAKATADSIGTELRMEGACPQVARLFALTGAGGLLYRAGVPRLPPRIA
ncbi:STAS domain-containing protein [Streptomyces sp. NBC_00433]